MKNILTQIALGALYLTGLIFAVLSLLSFFVGSAICAVSDAANSIAARLMDAGCGIDYKSIPKEDK